MEKKIFVLDTSVIIHDPNAIQQFEEHDIVIPLAVIREVDGFKGGNDQKAFNAREFSRFLDSLKEQHISLMEMVLLSDSTEGRLCVSHSGDIKNLPVEIQSGNLDAHIISTALSWKNRNPHTKVILVSKDTNVRLLGHACGIMTEDYKNGMVIEIDKIKYAPETIVVEESLIDRLMLEHSLPTEELNISHESLRANNCITLKGNLDTGKSALAVIEDINGRKKLRRLLKEENRIWGLLPRNREQIFASALLMNPALKLIAMTGKAGTGKTLMALAAGLEQTYAVPNYRYKKIVIMRPMVSVGKEIGWLPGNVEDKIAPWLKPIYDNIAFLLGEGNKNNDRRFTDTSSAASRVKQLIEDGVIEIEVMSFIRGRSINDAFIIIDEAQNLTPHEIKTAITRAAGISKIILTGDLDQIDTPYLDAYSSGLSHVIKKFNGHPIAGYIHLQKGERSELAELAANVL